MPVDLARALSAKRVNVIILGAPVTPDRAGDMIGRTDIAFGLLRYIPPNELVRDLRARLGFPRQPDHRPGVRMPRDAILEAKIARWRHAWGAIELDWLFNNQLLDGQGWCHPDGSIAFADELEDYPSALEMLDDCRQLAVNFPDLVMDVAAWGDDGSILGYPLHDAPPAPWPAALRLAARSPRVGFLIGGGVVDVVDGRDPRLFRRYGLPLSRAVEAALRDTRRNRQGRAIPPGMIASWHRRALAKGLVGPDR